MTTTLPRVAKRSEAARAKIQVAAKSNGKKRSDEFETEVRKAMATIVAEMAANDGIYPENKGAISKNEVARRAGVHSTTFFTKAQRAFGEEVQRWVDKLKLGPVVGRVKVRKELSKRVSDWNERYDGLAASHHKTELDLQQAQANLAEAIKEVEAVRQENLRLKQLLEVATSNKVTTMSPKRK